MDKLRLAALCTLLVWIFNIYASDNMLEDPRLITAAIAIELTEQQKQEFKQHLSAYLKKLSSATRKIMQRNNVTNLPKQITRKRNQLTRSLDKKMETLLTADQYSRYEEYRTLLLAKMSGALDGQSKEGTTSFSTMMGSGAQGT
tara:strand:- start:3 stop:434 length:432 start_codon:yes stop_codon:yes gene_type:complete